MDGRLRAATAAVTMLTFGACAESTAPEVDYQVIEEVEFDAALGIDLADFEKRGSGVYVKDVVVGDGAPVTYGTVPTVTFTGWLSDGSVFAQGTVNFIMGNFRLPIGFEEGLLNQKAGGTRVLIVPPEKGLGGVDQTHELGTKIVPAGSVLVYEVVVDSVAGP